MTRKRTAKEARRELAVLETSVLVNFLRVDRVDLLAQHPCYRFIVTDHVRREVTEDYPDQLKRLEKALASKVFDLASVDALDPHYVGLAKEDRYGAGECAAIALAVGRNIPIAIDDNRARKAARRISDAIRLESTETLMIGLIKSGVLDLASADAIKAQWEGKHRFALKFKTFADRI